MLDTCCAADLCAVASEQLFSALGQLDADWRSDLNSNNAKKLRFLAYNIRVFDYYCYALFERCYAVMCKLLVESNLTLSMCIIIINTS